MFESAELGRKLSKETFEAEEPALREALLDIQTELREKAKFSVLVVIAGFDGAGKGDAANLLSAWMDPRHLATFALDDPTKEERDRPDLYRTWQLLPAKGKIATFVSSWYTKPLFARLYGELKNAELDRALGEIRSFETMLSNENVLLLKFWFHLSKKAQKKRFAELDASPRTRWRVTPGDWERHDMYARYRSIAERTLRQTSTGDAPWTIIEAADPEYRNLTFGKTILDAVRRRLDESEAHVDGSPAYARSSVYDKVKLLGSLDLDRTIDKETYERGLDEAQGKLNMLFRSSLKRRSVIAVFEGADAAGKGGAIRRVTQAIDARKYTVVPIAAPSADEKAHPYLWRFWKQLPRRGEMTIFDRSWYGRVLVERIEGFCSTRDWMRAYQEINDFEEQLTEHGAIVIKFWLQISEDEQLRRFEERKNTTFKRYKIGPEDWRNREKWSAYQTAVEDMIERTSTEYAPWTLVESNDKRHARLKILTTIVERINHSL
jgi:AMP-polyphosphate phosphotransferase